MVSKEPKRKFRIPRKKIRKVVTTGTMVIIALLLIITILLAIVYTDLLPKKPAYAEESDQGIIRKTKDGTKYLIHPEEIRSGGPRKGGIGIDSGIPALAQENLKFTTVAAADEWIEDNELVLTLQYDGVKRVYPLQILVWHEIANDEVNGKPVLITYCPLCGSGIAYERTIIENGKKVTSRFGTSGKLYESNLVMYDEETDTYWTQIGGRAIIGELTGQILTPIEIDTVTWKNWKDIHPDSEVLSKETGFTRNYGNDPYPGYYEDTFLLFPVKNQNNIIHPKDVIYGVHIGNDYKAYRDKDLKLNTPIDDLLGDTPLRITKHPDGTVTIQNTQTEENLPKERDFWFAWYTFHPDTELYNN